MPPGPRPSCVWPPPLARAKRSYSLYLWHWPILIIAAEYAGKSTLSVKDNLGWDLVALGVRGYLSLLENPIRHAGSLRRIRWASIGLGVGLIALTLVTISVLSAVRGGATTTSNGRRARPGQDGAASRPTLSRY